MFDETQWRGLVDAIGSPAWANEAKFATLDARKQHEDELDGHITEWTHDHTAEELMALLQSKGVPAGGVQNARDMLENDAHVKARGYYQYLDHPETGRSAYDGAPFVLTKTPGTLRTPAPVLGQDNEYVCKEILGLSDDEIAEALIAEALF